MARLLFWSLCVCIASVAAPALAEKADRDKPTTIDAATSHADDLKQTVVFSGDVVLTKGTLRITGQELDFREDPEGYQYAVVTAPPGKRATFRQRRDPVRPGLEEYVDASADRLEYDGKAEIIKLIGHATVKRLENGAPRDEISAGEIVYDMRNSTYSGKGATKAGDGGRTRTIIAPRQTPEPAAPALPLEPSRSLKP
jgi:lipopolysaccharide export system protein LptA